MDEQAPPTPRKPSLFEMLDQLTAPVRRIREAFESPLRRYAEAVPQIAELARLIDEWVKNAPAKLRQALDGEFVPHPEMSLDDVTAVLTAFDASGKEAALDKLEQLYLEWFRDWRTTIDARWRASNRWPVLGQILQAHDAGLYFVSVPTALAQAEGLIAALRHHKGHMNGSALQQRVREIIDGERFFGPAVDAFASNLRKQFRHGDPVPPFSRHAILHGGDVTYGTARRSLASIVWLDFLLISEQEAAGPANRRGSFLG